MSFEKTKSGKPRKEIDLQIDLLERRVAELRVHYEQYFVDVNPLPPDKEHKEVKQLIKKLLNAPFKNSANRFRLRTVIQRYQTYDTYWNRVPKQREEGTYFRDVFKADLREQMQKEDERAATVEGAADRGMRQLFSSYEQALKKSGGGGDVNYDAFRKSLVAKAKRLKEKHGVKNISYKIVVKNGQVTVKASTKGKNKGKKK